MRLCGLGKSQWVVNNRSWRQTFWTSILYNHSVQSFCITIVYNHSVQSSFCTAILYNHHPVQPPSCTTTILCTVILYNHHSVQPSFCPGLGSLWWGGPRASAASREPAPDSSGIPGAPPPPAGVSGHPGPGTRPGPGNGTCSPAGRRENSAWATPRARWGWQAHPWAIREEKGWRSPDPLCLHGTHSPSSGVARETSRVPELLECQGNSRQHN